MIYAVTYLAILPPFGLLDAVWLSFMGPRLYKPTLGDILLANQIHHQSRQSINLIVGAAVPMARNRRVTIVP